MSKVATDTATSELTRHAVAVWGYLVRWGSRLTLAELVAMICCHSSYARAEALAAALESATGSAVCDRCGFRVNWQC